MTNDEREFYAACELSARYMFPITIERDRHAPRAAARALARMNLRTATGQYRGIRAAREGRREYLAVTGRNTDEARAADDQLVELTARTKAARIRMTELRARVAAYRVQGVTYNGHFRRVVLVADTLTDLLKIGRRATS